MEWDRVAGLPARVPLGGTPRHLLEASGFVRSEKGDSLDFWPQGLRVLRGLQARVRLEMEALGGQELLVPLTGAWELWKSSGRAGLFGRELVRFRTRNGQRHVLSPTHEEALVDLLKAQTPRQWPLLLFQFQTKFRDEETSDGLVTAREFLMKDAYSFHRSSVGLNEWFPRVLEAYRRLFEGLGLPVLRIEAASGLMGGSKSYEFVQLGPEDGLAVVLCPGCGYAANQDIATGEKSRHSGRPRPLEKVALPEAATCLDRAERLGLTPSQTAHGALYQTSHGTVMALVRGDYALSLEKLSQYLGEPVRRRLGPKALAGWALKEGCVSPIGYEGPRIKIVVDDSVANTPNLAYGSGDPNWVYLNGNFGRDYETAHVADIARIKASDTCRFCGSPLEIRPGRELGHGFKLGDSYARRLGWRLGADEAGFPHMGSYGIGLSRLLLAVAETHADEAGLRWPPDLAPYRAQVCADGDSPRLKSALDRLASRADLLIDRRPLPLASRLAEGAALGPSRQIVLKPGPNQGLVQEWRDRWSGRSGEAPYCGEDDLALSD